MYELDVPTDEGLKPLEEALDMIAQFAHAIRCAACCAFPAHRRCWKSFPCHQAQKGS